MANRKVTDSSAIAAAAVDSTNDQFMLVDVSDTTDSASGTNKKISPDEAKILLAKTDAEIKTAYENNANTNAFTDQNVLDIAFAKGKTQTLTDAANISWNALNGNLAKVTLTDNRILDLPTNLFPGVYILYVHQDATGSRTLDLSAFNSPSGVAPILTATGLAYDILTFTTFDAVTMDVVITSNLA